MVATLKALLLGQQVLCPMRGKSCQVGPWQGLMAQLLQQRGVRVSLWLAGVIVEPAP